MNRRDLLKLAGAAVIAPMLPACPTPVNPEYVWKFAGGPPPPVWGARLRAPAFITAIIEEDA